MSNPGTVVAGTDLTQLVGAHALHGLVVGDRVILDRDLSSHTTLGLSVSRRLIRQRAKTYHSVNTTAVASLDEQLHIGVHEWHSHGDIRAVGKDKVGVLAELLDEGEDVIPAAAVETGAVITQFIDNLHMLAHGTKASWRVSWTHLIHLKRSSDGLNQNSRTDGPPGHADVVLSEVEDVIPESGLEVGLHLGEVEVRTVAASNQLLGVVEEVKTKVEQAARDRLAVHSKVLLVKVPASSTSNQGGKGAVCTELVLLVSLLEVDLTANSIVQVDLTVDHVRPGRGTRVYACQFVFLMRLNVK